MVIRKVWICERDANEAKKITCVLNSSQKIQAEIKLFDEEKQLREISFNIRAIPDIVFIGMSFGSHGGIDEAKNLVKIWGKVPIVFMSEKREDIEKIFEIDPAYFLCKPIDLRTIRAAIIWGEKHRLTKEGKSVVLMEKGILYRISCNKLQYVESHKRVATFVEGQKRCSAYVKLDDLEKMLPVNFLRCHKSYLVNMDYVQTFSLDSILLFTGQKISVSRGRYYEAKKKFQDYLEGDLLV